MSELRELSDIHWSIEINQVTGSRDGSAHQQSHSSRPETQAH